MAHVVPCGIDQLRKRLHCGWIDAEDRPVTDCKKPLCPPRMRFHSLGRRGSGVRTPPPRPIESRKSCPLLREDVSRFCDARPLLAPLQPVIVSRVQLQARNRLLDHGGLDAKTLSPAPFAAGSSLLSPWRMPLFGEAASRRNQCSSQPVEKIDLAGPEHRH